MARNWKPDDVIYIHNNLARRKGLPVILLGTKMTLNEAIDALERVNDYVPPPPRPVRTIKDVSAKGILGGLRKFASSTQIKFDRKTGIRFVQEMG